MSDVLAVVLAPLMFVVPWRMRLLWEHLLPGAQPVRVGYGTMRGLKEMKVEVHNRHRREGVEAGSGGGGGGVLSPIVVFTHGGAWGSGMALMYRLLSSCFDRQLRCVTFTHNYHVYPTADVTQQVQQLRQLLAWLANEGEQYGGDASKVILVGHSSGAHLTLLHLLTAPSPPSASTTSTTSTPTTTSIAISSPTPSFSFSSTQTFSPFASPSSKREVRVIGAIGLSGVYDIASHYLFESRRGVHEFSPMKPACHDIPNFPQHSPTHIAQQLTQQQQQQPHSHHRPDLPPVLLVHGDSDQTVPDLESRRLCEALGGRVRRLGVSVEGRRVAEVEAWEKDVGSGGCGACECVIYADGDHGSTVLSLMTRTGSHLNDTLRTFIQRCADGPAAADGRQLETAASLHLAELQLVSRL